MNEPMGNYEIVDTKSLEALQRAEVDTQISTAKKYPRNIERFQSEATTLACRDEETAGSMFYSLPRDGKMIEGPSARLAEVVGSSWGNLRYAARVVSVDAQFITAQGVCHDLEKNVSASVDVKRRITTKNGKRYSDDMIVTTGNAACSIALRNAIFKVVPFAMVKGIYEDARNVAVGKAETLDARRGKAMDFIKKMGVSEERILNVIGRQSVIEIDLKDLATLKGMITAIREGDVTVDEAFPAPQTQEDEGKSKADRMANRFNKAKKTEAAPPIEAPTEPAPAAPAPVEPPQEVEPEIPAIVKYAAEKWKCDDFDKVAGRINRCTLALMKVSADKLDAKQEVEVRGMIDKGDLTLGK